jgi:hypothetical protein
VHEKIISAVKTVESVNDRMSYIILRGRLFHIIVLNVHAPAEDKTDYVKDNLYEELESIFDKVPKYHMKILLGDLKAKISAKENLGYYELKQHKLWFDEGCSKLLDQRKQAKLQWLQNPSEINGDNLKNVRCETSRHFRKKKEGISERQKLETNSKNKNIRDLYEFKRGYQDENGDLLADSNTILNR